MGLRLASRMELVKPSAIRELLILGSDPSYMSFGGGYPDPATFPSEALDRAFHRALSEQASVALQYTVSNGLPRLREQIAARMNLDGTPCTADEVIVLQGGQQGLDLVGKALVDRGDTIVVEAPTFLGGLLAFNPYEPRYVGVGMDEDGMLMDELESALSANPNVKLLYTIPDFQNPTGVTMSLARRRKLVELANRYDFVILEDTPYREIRFEGAQIPTIKSLDTKGRVVFLGSFSKLLAPGLRLGWAVASGDLAARLDLLKLATDTQCSTLNMTAVSILLDELDMDVHLAGLRSFYRRKRDIMMSAIRRSFPQEVSFTQPHGGLFTWLTLPDGMDSEKFMRERALPEARVAYVPGAGFYANDPRPNHARLSYATKSEDVIVAGMKALGSLLRQHTMAGTVAEALP